jgi:hypothetical protein
MSSAACKLLMVCAYNMWIMMGYAHLKVYMDYVGHSCLSKQVGLCILEITIDNSGTCKCK